MSQSDQTKLVINACRHRAQELITAATGALERDNLPNIAFHLAVLALEEIGKASLLGVRHTGHLVAGDDDPVTARLDDHVFKLFWAIWLPNFFSGKIKQTDFEQSNKMARRLHQKRLSALYVSPQDAATESVSPEEARNIVNLAQARLNMEGEPNFDFDLSKDSDLTWFLAAAGDAATFRLMFGSASLDKLKELGHGRKWVKWLRAQFEEAADAGKLRFEQELIRTLPSEVDSGKEKWRIRVRLFSPSHSVRNGPLRVWNQPSSRWIRLASVQGNKSALDVEITFRESVSIKALPEVSYLAARLFLLALNMGSVGFWWWSALPRDVVFYEMATDLEASPDITFSFTMGENPKFEWQKVALGVEHVQKAALCFGGLARLPDDALSSIAQSYFSGLALVAKSDMHMRLSPLACREFSRALKAALHHFGDWTGKPESWKEAVDTTFRELLSEADRKELVDLTESDGSQSRLGTEKAAILKALCDGYLQKQFLKMIDADEGMDPVPHPPI